MNAASFPHGSPSAARRLAVLVVSVLLGLLAVKHSTAETAKPNIILIYADDKYQCESNTVEITPKPRRWFA